MTSISLFSGMGGDSLGMKMANMDVVSFNEMDKYSIESHKINFPNCTLIEDNNKINIIDISNEIFMKYKGNIDLIFAGHPCQGFSNGGKKLPDDPRNTLFREFLRVTTIIKPKYIIGENVDGLLTRKTSNGEKYMDIIIREFEKQDYKIYYKVCHCVKYNIPQLRKRLIYVGIRNDLNESYSFPSEINIPQNLKHIIKFNMEGSLKISKLDFDMTTIPEECILTNMYDEQNEDENAHPYLKLKCKTRNNLYNGKSFDSLLSFSKRDSPIHAEIIDIRNPCKTIICSYDHQPRLFVPLRNKNGYFLRCLLPNELKQIQGFPEDYIICGNKKQQIKQIGNAAPPLLIQKIVEQLKLK